MGRDRFTGLGLGYYFRHRQKLKTSSWLPEIQHVFDELQVDNLNVYKNPKFLCFPGISTIPGHAYGRTGATDNLFTESGCFFA